MIRNPSQTRPVTQQGFALVITLVFLTVMTLIGLSAAQNSALSEKVTSNFQLRDRALKTATGGAAEVAECIQAAVKSVPPSDPITACNSLADSNWQLTVAPTASQPLVTFQVTGNERNPSGAVLASASITVDIGDATHPSVDSRGKILRWQQSN